MRFSTKHDYRFVLMTADVEMIDVLTGTYSTKKLALERMKKRAAIRGKKLGIVYVTDMSTNECEVYTASGRYWIRERIKAMEKRDNTAAVDIGKRLQAIRMEKGLSCEEVCERAGIKPSTLVAIESGAYNSGIREIAKIAEALDTHIWILPN